MIGRYKAYSEYKKSGVEWTGLIPKHWALKRIKDTANLINGFPFDSKKFETNKGMPLVRIRDINSKNTQVGFTGSVPDESLINDGDILIGMDGDFNVALWSGGVAALNQRVACIRTDSELLQKYIYYILPFNMKVINDLTYFTTVKHLSNIDILKTVYPLPPTNELCNIVNFLDYETSKIDTLIAKQEKLIELLKEKRQAVISHAVTKGLNPDAPMRDSGVEWLGEVPEHWEVLPTKRFFRLVTEPSIKNHGQELLSVYAAIGVAPRKDLEQKGNKASNTDGYWAVRKGDIIVNKLLAWMGAIGYSDYDGVTSPAYDILRKTKDINPKFYHYLFRQKFTQNEFKRWSRGIMEMRLRLYFEELGRIMMPMPPKEEQNAIVQEIEKMHCVFAELEEKANLQIELLKERKTALISAAVTGKIDVRDFVSEQGQPQGI